MFLKHRRKEIEKLPRSNPFDLPLEQRAKLLSGAVWGKKHDKEAKRQDDQRTTRLAEAAASDLVIPTATSRQLAAGLDVSRAKRRVRLGRKQEARDRTTTRRSHVISNY